LNLQRTTLIAAWLVAFATSLAGAQTHNFNVPSDDRWHYPFNATPGTRFVGSCFGAAGIPTFNDRDGEVMVAWNTSASIPTGQGAASYQIASITVTLRNIADAQWPIDLTPDEWFTFDLNGDTFINADGIPRGQPGDTDGESDDADAGRPIEMFGMGFGPVFTAQSWNEFSIYVGSDSFGDFQRDPFPFVFRPGTAEMLHVEDNVKGLHNAGLSPPFCTPSDSQCPFTPTPWAIGVPVGYTPGSQATPFDVTFTIDLTQSGGLVRQYFQQQLDAGRVMVAVTCLRETAVMGGQNGFPTFFMKESPDPGSLPARLTIVLSPCSAGDGDINCDGSTDMTDVPLFVNAVLGVPADAMHETRGDMDSSGSANGNDIRLFVAAFLAGP
jgi:hypothetical protein